MKIRGVLALKIEDAETRRSDHRVVERVPLMPSGTSIMIRTSSHRRRQLARPVRRRLGRRERGALVAHGRRQHVTVDMVSRNAKVTKVQGRPLELRFKTALAA